jgi:hypothetical protein
LGCFLAKVSNTLEEHQMHKPILDFDDKFSAGEGLGQRTEYVLA